MIKVVHKSHGCGRPSNPNPDDTYRDERENTGDDEEERREKELARQGLAMDHQSGYIMPFADICKAHGIEGVLSCYKIYKFAKSETVKI